MTSTPRETKIDTGTDWDKEHERRRRVRFYSDLAVLGANAIGGILAQLYFVINGSVGSISDIPPTIRNQIIIVTIIAIAVLLALGKILGDKWDREVKNWYLDPKSMHEPPSEKVQRNILNNPMHTALMSWGMWVLAGLFYGISSAISMHGERLVINRSIFTITFLNLTGISGTISATLVYFITERIWQPEIPLFFPDREISRIQAFRMTIRRRVFVLFIIQAIPLVVLAVVAYQNAVGLAQTGDAWIFIPRLRRLEIFIVGVGVLSALTLALTLGFSLIDGVEVLNTYMARVRRG